MSDDHCSDKPDPVLKQTGIAKIVNLGYYSRANGKSYYRVQCECGQVQEVYAWRGTKKCCRCGLILSVKYSPEGRLIVSELPEVKPQPRMQTVGFCNSCAEEIHYVHGVGWCHCEGKEFDHVALPVPDSIKRIVEKE
jgi:hypothetical protein